MAKVPHTPDGYHTVTAYLTLRDAVAAVDFYRRAFGAELVMKLTMPDGKYAHAEIKIGDSHIMMAEENPEWGNKSPQTLGGSPVSFMVRAGCRRSLRTRAGGRVHAGATGRGSVLRRPHRHAEGPLRLSMVDRHPHRRRQRG
jgi:PhnB protein